MGMSDEAAFKVIPTRQGLQIVPHGLLARAFLEEVLGLRRSGDEARLYRADTTAGPVFQVGTPDVPLHVAVTNRSRG